VRCVKSCNETNGVDAEDGTDFPDLSAPGTVNVGMGFVLGQI